MFFALFLASNSVDLDLSRPPSTLREELCRRACKPLLPKSIPVCLKHTDHDGMVMIEKRIRFDNHDKDHENDWPSIYYELRSIGFGDHLNFEDH